MTLDRLVAEHKDSLMGTNSGAHPLGEDQRGAHPWGQDADAEDIYKVKAAWTGFQIRNHFTRIRSQGFEIHMYPDSYPRVDFSYFILKLNFGSGSECGLGSRDSQNA